MNLRRFRPRSWPAAPLAALVLAGCLGAPAPRRSPVQRLPPDSLALLKEALGRARPAYATQAEALRAGTYQTGAPPAQRAVLVDRGAEPMPGGVVVQIMAHRDRAAAEDAARTAEARFPGRRARIEAVGDIYRVSLGPWESEQAAAAELPRIRTIYPDAWLRRAAP